MAESMSGKPKIMEILMNSRQLSIPIYLNQRIVFDLLAIVEGGFSHREQHAPSGPKHPRELPEHPVDVPTPDVNERVEREQARGCSGREWQ